MKKKTIDPMGHIAHLRKHSTRRLKFCQCILDTSLKLFPLGKRLNHDHTRMPYAKFGWNYHSGSGEARFLNFVNIFMLFQNYLPLEKGMPLHLYKLESFSPKDDLCQVWFKLAPWFWRIFFFFNFCYIFHWKMMRPFIWINLNLIHPRMLVPSLV
mgnify:CR=1 FL=1